MDLSKYKALYLSEAAGHVDNMVNNLLYLESNPADSETIATFFRHAHSMKGMSAAMGYPAVTELAHALESFMDLFRGGGRTLQTSDIDQMLSAAEHMRQQIEAIRDGHEAPHAPIELIRALREAPTTATTPRPTSTSDSLDFDLPEVTAKPAPAPVPEPAPPASAAALTGATRPVSDPSARPFIVPEIRPISGGSQRPATGASARPATGASARPSTGAGRPASGATTAPPPAPAPPPLPPDIRPATSGAMPIPANAKRVRATVHLDPHARMRSLRAFVLVRDLAAIHADVIAEPGLDELKAGTWNGETLIVTLATVAPLAQLEERIRGNADVVRTEIAEIAVPAAQQRPRRTEITLAREVRVGAALLDRFLDVTRELMAAQAQLKALLPHTHEEGFANDLEAVSDRIGRHIRELYHRTLDVRTVPLSSITQRFPQLVRETARQLGRGVRFEIQGDEVEMDRGVIESLASPLLHILRNAVDHGIESPEERAAVGKDSDGRLLLRAERLRDKVRITVEDDGRGLNPGKLIQKAIEKGLLDRMTAQAIPEERAFELICEPGFSTRDEVTEISGRGVGMDVVRKTVEQLGGRLSIHSELGRGTRFELLAPISLALLPALVVRASGHRLAVPVNDIAAVYQDEATSVPAQIKVPNVERPVPTASLAQILGIASAHPNHNHTQTHAYVLVETRHGLWGYVVDAVEATTELVVRPLGDPFNRIPGISGASVLGDGSPVFIIDVPLLHDLRAIARAAA